MRVVKVYSRKPKYRRILLKLSGEVLGNRETGDCIDPGHLAFMAERVKKVHAMGCEVGIVLGGGNIFRGLTGAGKGVNRVTGDSMGQNQAAPFAAGRMLVTPLATSSYERDVVMNGTPGMSLARLFQKNSCAG